jgi:hypothetical protein
MESAKNGSETSAGEQFSPSEKEDPIKQSNSPFKRSRRWMPKRVVAQERSEAKRIANTIP